MLNVTVERVQIFLQHFRNTSFCTSTKYILLQKISTKINITNIQFIDWKQ